MSICNIFKYRSEEPSFYTFSEYTNDLVSNVNNDGMTVAKPSKFICLNLFSTDHSIGEADRKVFVEWLYKFYDNATCVLRDANNGDDYKHRLLGGFMSSLNNFMKSGDTFSGPGNVDITKNPFACGDIDVFSDGCIDGVKYDEIVCYLAPDASINSILSDPEDKLSDIGGDYPLGEYISGYEGENDSIYASWDNKDYSFPHKTISEIPKKEGNFYFDTIIILYDLYIGNSKEPKYTNIPLGVYILPETVEKKVSNMDGSYGQGASYAVRIGMRFASTVNGNKVMRDYVDVSLDRSNQINSLIYTVDKLSDTIDAMNNMVSKFQEYHNNLKTRMDSIMGSSFTNASWTDYDIK